MGHLYSDGGAIWHGAVDLRSSVYSSMPNFTPIGATCRPCGAKKTSNHPLSNLNTGALRCTQCCGNKHATKKLKTGLVASYDTWPANEVGLFLFCHFINSLFIYFLIHLPTYLRAHGKSFTMQCISISKAWWILMLILLQIYYWVWRWKHFDNVTSESKAVAAHLFAPTCM